MSHEEGVFDPPLSEIIPWWDDRYYLCKHDGCPTGGHLKLDVKFALIFLSWPCDSLYSVAHFIQCLVVGTRFGLVYIYASDAVQTRWYWAFLSPME